MHVTCFCVLSVVLFLENVGYIFKLNCFNNSMPLEPTTEVVATVSKRTVMSLKKI